MKKTRAKPFNRERAIRKIAGGFNKAYLLRKAEAAAVGAGLGVGITSAVMAKKLQPFILANIASLGITAATESLARLIEQNLLARCVGKPRVSARIAQKAKDPNVRKLLLAIAGLKSLSAAEKTALSNFLGGTAKRREKIIAREILKKEMQKQKL
ncbi:MAG: hypothetical protein J4478_01670 [Candidatus Diapherotrites archaeon]|uniref:Uncharacterized protein n=1 Tax=Candidatus Iainarchaeum sp. TaxID=3101447 RepID=A0A7J4KTI5_9ARCH|nr:hypothetical protein [Candidatus Diapherotrites archaeon]HIH21347.1 hypothetical protein [Candidatus Diapherotrites archaeon]HIH33004.1 hypothetical protein [Candidatus Diapherotrites archaeon]